MDLLSWAQIAASGATLVLVWWTARLSFGRLVGLVSLTIGVLHLAWITYAGFALSETIFTLLLAVLSLATWHVLRRLTFGAGALWGAVFFAALLFKGTHIFLVALFLIGLVIWKGRRSWKAALAISVVVWAGFLGHGMFTYQTVGAFQMTASAGGLNFVEGKCPIKDNQDSVGASWLSPLYYQLGKREKKVWSVPFYDSAYFFGAGLNCIGENPIVLVQSLEGIPFLFVGNWMWPSGNLPYADWIRIYEMLFASFAIVGLCVSAVLANRRSANPTTLLMWVVPVVALFATVYIFKSEVRFRVPFDIWIIPLASAGWVWPAPIWWSGIDVSA